MDEKRRPTDNGDAGSVRTLCRATALLCTENRLPTATDLSLAFLRDEPHSPGTQATMMMNVGRGGRSAKTVSYACPGAWKTREIDFGEVTKTGTTIPWGDVATAFHSTAIPNIEVYTVIPPTISKCSS